MLQAIANTQHCLSYFGKVTIVINSGILWIVKGMIIRTSEMCPPARPFPFFCYPTSLLFVFCIKGKAGYVAQGSNFARDRASAPLFTYVNEDKLKSIETYARTLCLVLSASLSFTHVNPCAFLTSVSNPQVSLTCWTTMRCPLEYQRRSPRRSFRRTGSLLMLSWRPTWWRCSKTSGGGEKALSTNTRHTDPAQPLFTLLSTPLNTWYLHWDKKRVHL